MHLGSMVELGCTGTGLRWDGVQLRMVMMIANLGLV